MPFLELFDETLDINSTRNYSLSLQLGVDGVSFAVMDNLRAKYILLRSFEPENGLRFSIDEVKEILMKDDFLAKKYHSVKIILNSTKFTLVPAPLYEPEKRETFFKLNHILEDDGEIIVNRVRFPDAFLLFSVNKSFRQLAEVLLPGQVPYHFLKPLLVNVNHYGNNQSKSYLHLHVLKGSIVVLAVVNGVLKYCNCFEYKSPEDLLYYLLNVYKALGISVETPVHCSGGIMKHDETYSLISSYIKDLFFINPVGNFTYSYLFDDANTHKFINLFSLASCE